MSSNQDYYQSHPHSYGNPASYSNTLEQDHDPVLPGGVIQWNTIQAGVSSKERAMPNVSLSRPSHFQHNQHHAQDDRSIVDHLFLL
jgi:hypothetical protein